MAGIMGNRKANNEEANVSGNQSQRESHFYDRTAENWYCKDNSKKIVFCNSIDDIIEGSAESLDFIRQETSIKREKNTEGKIIERKKYVLFTLAGNDKILVRLRGRLK
jgi:hypothetical protein